MLFSSFSFFLNNSNKQTTQKNLSSSPNKLTILLQNQIKTIKLVYTFFFHNNISTNNIKKTKSINASGKVRRTKRLPKLRMIIHLVRIAGKVMASPSSSRWWLDGEFERRRRGLKLTRRRCGYAGMFTFFFKEGKEMGVVYKVRSTIEICVRVKKKVTFVVGYVWF